jgi:quinol monooxygenase YgiN
MNNSVVLWVEYTVKPGKLADFRSVVTEMKAESNKEAGFLTQEIFYTGDGYSGFINERYRSSEEMIEHMNQWAATFGVGFLAACNVTRMAVMGEVSQEVIDALQGYAPQVARRLVGFAK